MLRGGSDAEPAECRGVVYARRRGWQGVGWRDALGVPPYSRPPDDVKGLHSLGKGRNRLAHVHGRSFGRGEQGGELRLSGYALTLTRGAKLDIECPAR